MSWKNRGYWKSTQRRYSQTADIDYINGVCAFGIYVGDLTLMRHTLNNYCDLNSVVDSQTIEPLQHLNLSDKLYKFIPTHRPHKLLRVMELLFGYFMDDSEKNAALKDWCELIFENKVEGEDEHYVNVAKWFIYKGLNVNDYPPLVALLKEVCSNNVELKLLFKLF